MKDTGAERRNFARERTHIEVEVSQDFRLRKGTMEYVSFGGAFVSLGKTPEKDSLIQVKFDIPGELASFQASARVVWVQKDKAIGIQFLDLSESEKLKLEKLLIG
jgi:PilZ domain